MGILSDLFETYLPEMPKAPVIISDYPHEAEVSVLNGHLPILNVGTLMLKDSEVCHYIDKACLVTKKIEKQRKRNHGGFSFRLARGVYYHTGSGKSKPVEYEIPVYTNGYLYITNLRVVFASKEVGIDKKLSEISSVSPYSDAIGLQLGSKVYNFMTPSAESAFRTIKLLSE